MAIEKLTSFSKAPYIWSVVVLTLLSCALVMGVLLVRPQVDAMDVITKVLTGLAPTIAAVLAYLKSQDTHLSVNSRLDAFMTEHAKVARAEGILQGTSNEQARTAAIQIPAVVVSAPNQIDQKL